MTKKTALSLLLADGTRLDGEGFGYLGETDGEVVFTTGMTGYPEAFTDPSYRGQILTMTYPLVGNYGVPDDSKKSGGISDFFESDEVQIRALLVSEYCEKPFHYECHESLDSWLKRHKVPGISGIDTRALTQRLREKGSMLGKIVKTSSLKPGSKKKINVEDPNKINLVDQVSTDKVKKYSPKGKKAKKTVLLYDFGVKYNIIRCLLKRGVEVIRVPWDYDVSKTKYKFDGICVSPGPGDPKVIRSTTKNIEYALENDIKLFGICLGHQLLALTIGGNTYKMKYGHRGVNQPCIDTSTNRCYITSQNHGFEVESKSLPKGWEEWFVNGNDGTCEGIRHKSGKFSSIQFHPESNPGPTDTEYLFDEFVGRL